MGDVQGSSLQGVTYPRRKFSGCNYLRAIFLGGNCPGVNCTEGNCPGGNCLGAIVLGGSCPGANCPGGNCPRWQLSGGKLSGGQLSRGDCLVPVNFMVCLSSVKYPHQWSGQYLNCDSMKALNKVPRFLRKEFLIVLREHLISC